MEGMEILEDGNGRISRGEENGSRATGKRKVFGGKTKKAETPAVSTEVNSHMLDDAISATLPTRPAIPTRFKASSKAPSQRHHPRTFADLCAPPPDLEQAANFTVSSSAHDPLGSMDMPDQRRNGERELSTTAAQSQSSHGTKSPSRHEAITDSSILMHPPTTVEPSPTAATIRHQVQSSRAQERSVAESHSVISLTHTLADHMDSLSLKTASRGLPPPIAATKPAYVPPHRRRKEREEVFFRSRGTPVARAASNLQADAKSFHPSNEVDPEASTSATLEKSRKGFSTSHQDNSEEGGNQDVQDALQPIQPRMKGNVQPQRPADNMRSKKRNPQGIQPASRPITITTQQASHAPAKHVDGLLPDHQPATSGNRSIDGDRTLTHSAARYGDFNPVLFNKTYLAKAHTGFPSKPVSAAPAPNSHRPTPTQAYLEQADLPTEPHIGSPRSLLVVLDLNGTVCYRRKNKPGHWTFKPRPGVTEFLDYLVQNHKVLVWSSARPENVAGVCAKIFDAEQLVQLVGVWGRDTLRLTPQEYDAKVQVYKQLSWLWDDSAVAASSIGIDKWGQQNTVLIDDSLLKAASEPHNLIQIEEFDGKMDKTKVDVLEQVVEYLEMVRMTKDVSATIKKCPFVYKMKRVE